MHAYLVVVAVLVLLLVYREWSNQKVIDSLLNRLMSRDYRDYKVVTEIQPRPRKLPRLGSMTDEALAAREEQKSLQE